MIYFFVFIVGLCVGSFLNVVIDRIPHHRSIVKGRSECDFCHHTLAWYDLIPVFSFVFLRGACRYCKHTLSLQYPIVEILTGVLFLVSYVLLLGSPGVFALGKSFLLLSLFATFFALSVMDIKYGILSDTLILFSVGLTVGLLLFSPALFFAHLLVGFVCLGVLLLLFLVTKGRGIGLGDVKLSFVMGLLLGFPSIVVAFYIAFLTGACIAIILIVAKKKKLVGGTIAFGPFLLLGTYISWYFGSSVWMFFLHILGIL